MTKYTVYIMNTQDLRTDVEHLVCASDAEAINSTLDLADGNAAELWRGRKRLLRVRPTRSEGGRSPDLHRASTPVLFDPTKWSWTRDQIAA
jgi:hypothetical protein